MFARLESSIKGEVATLHNDLNQILRRVEETEEQLESQTSEIKELQDQMAELQRDIQCINWKTRKTIIQEKISE